jgi:23S rRNA (cytosine1962-C5)-methyltransferase
MKTLTLRSGEDKRLRAGHLWVFANEVDTTRRPMNTYEPGEPVRVEAASGRLLGRGYVNPATLITARLLARDAETEIDETLFVERIGRALALRERLFSGPYYRLIASEGDFLPGLTVDRYGENLVCQVATAGMERLADTLVGALKGVPGVRNICFKNDVGSRELEGLELFVRDVHGDVPEIGTVVENGVEFAAPLKEGQKTGWFYDQRRNRDHAAELVRDGTMLDVFSYVGGFGVLAAVRGASRVVCVDASAQACDVARENAARSGVTDRLEVVEGDGFAVMEELAADGALFDVVNIDPPAFAKRKKDVAKARAAYEKAIRLGLRLVAPGGFLVVSSCSQHFSRKELTDALRRAALKTGHDARIVRQSGQGPDHPVHPAMAETFYLKTLTAHVTRSI